ncbi:MAG: alpha/beta fold hydrolase [Pseudomonadota bacterium]
MSPESTPQTSRQLPHLAQALAAAAARHETPCGTGSMVWHVWTPEVVNDDLAPLLLFHGGSGSWTHWLRNIRALVASGRSVYVPDLPGFGDSARPAQGRDADSLSEYIEQGLQLLLGERSCDVAGFSFGGMVAGFLAAQFPARVARLILVGAPGMGIKPEQPVRLQAWRHLGPELQDAVHRSNLAALMLYKPEAITELALGLHVANVWRDRMPGRRLARTDVLAALLPGIRCPLYAIYGREDALYRGRMDGLVPVLQQAGDFRGLTFIEAAGHWAQFEQAGAFNEALLAVLDAAP